MRQPTVRFQSEVDMIRQAKPAQEIATKYLLANLWPFVLAFAIALRITRVTADVSDWPL